MIFFTLQSECSAPAITDLQSGLRERFALLNFAFSKYGFDLNDVLAKGGMENE